MGNEELRAYSCLENIFTQSQLVAAKYNRKKTEWRRENNKKTIHYTERKKYSKDTEKKKH